MLILFHSIFDIGELEYKFRVQNLALLDTTHLIFTLDHQHFMYIQLGISSPTTFLNVGGRVGHFPSLGYDHSDGGIGRH